MSLKKTLSEQIYSILKEDILMQRIPTGSKLTLKVLQDRFGVSSSPIREALTRLSGDSLVSHFSNIGVNVVSLEADDIREIYQFMADLDSLAMRYAAQDQAIDQLKNDLKENIQLQVDSLTEGPYDVWRKGSDDFHLIFYDYARNGRLTRTAERLRYQLSILAYQYEESPDIQKNITEEHQQIYEKYIAGDIDGAEALMHDHLQRSMEYALSVIGSR